MGRIGEAGHARAKTTVGDMRREKAGERQATRKIRRLKLGSEKKGVTGKG